MDKKGYYFCLHVIREVGDNYETPEMYGAVCRHNYPDLYDVLRLFVINMQIVV